MTDNESIKAWECCKKDKFEPHCSKCPLEERPDCQIVLESEILPLLNRQKSEIERLKDLNNQLETDIINANMNLEHITYEFDLLKQEKSVVIAEAIKEFLKKAKDLSYESRDWSHGEHPFVVEWEDLMTIYDEMVGEG